MFHRGLMDQHQCGCRRRESKKEEKNVTLCARNLGKRQGGARIFLIHSNAMLAVAGNAEARLTSEDLAFTSIATDVPRVGDRRAVLASFGAVTATTAKVDILLGVDASPGVALGQTIRHVADRLASRARDSLCAPVAGCDLRLGFRALVVSWWSWWFRWAWWSRRRRWAGWSRWFANAARWGWGARRSWVVAALVLVIPLSTRRACWVAWRVGRAGNTAAEAWVPLEFRWAALVRWRRWGVWRPAVRKTAVTSPRTIVRKLRF